MSNEILTQLLGAHAFDGSPLHVDMPAFHVPFDDQGRAGTESSVLRAARSTERLGVKGPIGCGKTSLIRYTLDDPTGTIAPIWVSVAFDDDQVVLDVRRFAAHLVQSVVRDAQRAGTLTARDRDAILTAAATRRPLPGSDVGSRPSSPRCSGLPAANSPARSFPRSKASTCNGPPARSWRTSIGRSSDRRLRPPTGHRRRRLRSFTRRPGSGSTRDQLVSAFFGPILRALTELHAGLIVSVHDEYLEMPSFERARREHGALERLLAVPPVVSGQLGRILDRRAQLAANVKARPSSRPPRSNGSPSSTGRGPRAICGRPSG